jgi:sulfur-carrier protein
MAVVWIPPLARDLSGGQAQVAVSGATVAQVMNGLDAAFPGMKARLCSGDDLVPFIAVFVDGRRGQLRMLEPVGEQSEIHFVPAQTGG